MKARIEFLVLAWLSAFVIVMALFLAFGSVLDDLPLAGRALLISGVLVITMTQLALPLINRFLRARRARTAGGGSPAPRA
jgi:antibiotic biosynthesis monooxygenase (ABM) superfamily enzyme